HKQFQRFFESWDGPVVSTEAVLTEAMHLLGRMYGGQQVCLDFFLAGGALLVPSSTSALRRSRESIDKYADLPMDYADSTLVVLAEELGTNMVFSTDRRDFEVYRINGRGRFRIKP
ncbi:MAG: type II toxin-antitoxin system VapC family toxin, partial [Gammaproteobacteria bacterium]